MLTIIKYFARIECDNGYHVKSNLVWCTKHNELTSFYCRLCRKYSMVLQYCYRCTACHQTLCMHHFIEHTGLAKIYKTAACYCLADTFTINNRMDTAFNPHLGKKLGAHILNKEISINMEDDYTDSMALISAAFANSSNIKSIGTP